MSLILPSWVAHLSDTDGEKKKRNTLFSLSVHPDGSRLATAGLDSKIRIWSTDAIVNAAAAAATQTNASSNTAANGAAHQAPPAKASLASSFSNADAAKGQDGETPPEGALLCTLARHTGSVLVVRWSPSGRFLASGSDDTICLVWDIDPTGLGGSTFGSSSNEVNLESWRTHRRLAGHESDVVDLAWSADEEDSFLATVGLDSVAYVWSGPRPNAVAHHPGYGYGGGGAAHVGSFERLRRIDSHNGFVKGVVWDPIGRYLATASDDKTVKIWRTSDWQLERTISEPFEKSPSTTFFRRPSWSPDGAHLLCANAMSGPVFVASVVQRRDWSSNIHLVGHENSVTVTAFSPRLFHERDGSDQVATVLALGSQDQSISVWITGQARPLLVARDVFDRAVMDLSWSADGLTLYASSADGHVAVFCFTEELLSELASDEELDKARRVFGYQQTPRLRTVLGAGDALVNGVARAAGASGGTTDRPNVLVARKPGRARPSAVPPVPRPATSGAAATTTTTTRQRLQQHITITRDGKRRIRPTLLGGGADYDAANGLYDVSVGEGVTASSASLDAIESMRTTADTTGVGTMASSSTGEKRKAPASAWDELEAVATQAANRGGRLRDTAARTLGGGGEASTSLGGSLSSARAGAPIRRLAMGPSSSLAPHGEGGVGDAAASALLLPPPPLLNVYRRCQGDVVLEARNFEGNRPSEIRFMEATGNHGSGSTASGGATGASRVVWLDYVPLGARVLVAAISTSLTAVGLDDGGVVVYSAKGRRLASMQLPTACHRLEANREWLAALLVDGTLRRWNLREERESPARSVSLRGVLRPTVGGSVDGRGQAGAAMAGTGAAATAAAASIRLFWLHTNGTPVVLLSDERAYALDARKSAWCCIASGWYAECSQAWESRSRGRGSLSNPPASLSTSSSSSSSAMLLDAAGVDADGGAQAVAASERHHFAVTPTLAASLAREPVRAIESLVNDQVVNRSAAAISSGGGGTGAAGGGTALQRPRRDGADEPGRNGRGGGNDDDDFELATTLRHLETRLEACRLLNSAGEYRANLVAYARRLAEAGIRNQADELLRALLGPVYFKVGPAGVMQERWEPTVLGLNKRELLLEALRAMRSSRTSLLQGLVQTYSEQLRNVTSASTLTGTSTDAAATANLVAGGAASAVSASSAAAALLGSANASSATAPNALVWSLPSASSSGAAATMGAAAAAGFLPGFGSGYGYAFGGDAG